MSSSRILLPFVILAVICTVILSIISESLKERISANIKMEKLKVIAELMPVYFDNNIYTDTKTVTYLGPLGRELTTTAYRARQAGKPVGLVFMPVTAQGYNGAITMAIGIHYDGILTGVRILQHQETEGLGSKVDQHQSDWLDHFTDQSFAKLGKALWAVKSDSGYFDQLSGATITSRGVVDAVKTSLDNYSAKRQSLFAD